MVPDYPRAYIAQLELLVAKAGQRAREQGELVERLERSGVDTAEARHLLLALEHHAAELRAELRLARRLAGDAH